MPLDQKTLRFCLQAYLDVSESSLKDFVVDVLSSDASPANFAIDEPDLTIGQKWDAHQPIKTERVRLFLSGKQSKLSSTYVEAIVPFLREKGFIDASRDLNFLERPPSPQTVMRDYVAQFPKNPFVGQVFFRPASKRGFSDIRGLRFWNRTEIQPLVYLTIFHSTEASFAVSNSTSDESALNSEEESYTQYFAMPFFVNENTLRCQFATVSRFQGFGFEIPPIEIKKLKDRSVSFLFNRRKYIFCKFQKNSVEYIDKKNIRVILGCNKSLFTNNNIYKEYMNKREYSDILFETASIDNLIGFLVAAAKCDDVNQIDQSTGWNLAHFACASGSSDILYCLYGSEQDALQKIEAHMEVSDELISDIDVFSSLQRVRAEFDPLSYDGSGNLPSSLVRGMSLDGPVGDFARKLHAMVIAAEMYTAEDRRMAFDRNYTLDI